METGGSGRNKKLIKNGSSLNIGAQINNSIQPMLNPSLPFEMGYF